MSGAPGLALGRLTEVASWVQENNSWLSTVWATCPACILEAMDGPPADEASTMSIISDSGFASIYARVR
jgi:hypothetical protein